MGYTHYWRFKGKDLPPLEAREKISNTLQHLYDNRYRLFGDKAVDLAVEYDEADSPPENSADAIRFNGRGSQGHETFAIDWHNPVDFEFCKTAMKPYDFWVVTTLTLINTELPETLSISSDGDVQEWMMHLDVLKNAVEKEIIDHPELINPNVNIDFDNDSGNLVTRSELIEEEEAENSGITFNSFF